MEVENVDVRNDYEQYRTMNKGNFQSGKLDYSSLNNNELSAYNLSKILERYPEFNKQARSNIQQELSTFPHLYTMNLEILAAVLVFLKSYPSPKPEYFKDNIISAFFYRLLPNKKISDSETKRIYIKLKCIFLKYIVAINSYRSVLNEGLNSEDEEIEEEVEEVEEVNEEEEIDEEIEEEIEDDKYVDDDELQDDGNKIIL